MSSQQRPRPPIFPCPVGAARLCTSSGWDLCARSLVAYGVLQAGSPLLKAPLASTGAVLIHSFAFITGHRTCGPRYPHQMLRPPLSCPHKLSLRPKKRKALVGWPWWWGQKGKTPAGINRPMRQDKRPIARAFLPLALPPFPHPLPSPKQGLPLALPLPLSSPPSAPCSSETNKGVSKGRGCGSLAHQDLATSLAAVLLGEQCKQSDRAWCTSIAHCERFDDTPLCVVEGTLDQFKVSNAANSRNSLFETLGPASLPSARWGLSCSSLPGCSSDGRRALIDVVDSPAVCWWSDSCGNVAAVVFNVRSRLAA